MKKILFLTLVIALLAASTFPSLAMSTGVTTNGLKSLTAKKQLYSLAGYVKSIDAVNRTVTVTVAVGNRLAKPLIGQDVVLQTNSSTRFKLSGGTTISFDYLKVGQQVSSNGRVAAGVWTARRITVGALLLRR